MSYDNALGLILAVLLTAYLVYALVFAGEAVMTTAGWIQLLVFLGLIFAVTPLLGGYMAKVWRGGKAPGDRVFAPGRARHLPHVRDRPRERAALDGLHVLAARLQRGLGAVRVRVRAPAVAPAVQPRPPGRGPPRPRVEHRRQLRDQHELAELRRRVDDEPPHADGRARGAELRVGGRRSRGDGRADPRPRPRRKSRTIGNFWVDLIRTTLRILLPLVVRLRDRAREPGRDPELPRLDADASPRIAGRHAERSPAARSRARSRSSSSAPTAAGSSTRTRRTRSRTPTGSRT